MIILLPPSEGKASGGKGLWRPTSGSFGKALADARIEVAQGLGRTPASALKVRGETAQHALSANQRLFQAPSLKAADRYTGVVYQGLSVGSLDAELHERALKSVVVVSGLLGLTRLGEATPDYRAPMDATVSNVGKLTNFWRPMVSPLLQRLAQKEVVIDLLTQAHRGAVDPSSANWVTIDFVHPTLRGGHAAKFAKGQLARWLLAHEVSQVSKWRSEGWRAVVR